MDELEIEKYLRLRGRISVFLSNAEDKRKFFGMRLCSCKNGERPRPAMKEILLFIQRELYKNRRIADEVRVRV